MCKIGTREIFIFVADILGEFNMKIMYKVYCQPLAWTSKGRVLQT